MFSKKIYIKNLNKKFYWLLFLAFLSIPKKVTEKKDLEVLQYLETHTFVLYYNKNPTPALTLHHLLRNVTITYTTSTNMFSANHSI